MTAGQSTRRAPSRALLASAALAGLPPQLYHGRKITTSQLLPDTFAFPGTLVCVSKNTKLVPKPGRKTSLSPARGSPQAPSPSEERLRPPSQWALSPRGPHATWDPGTPSHPGGSRRTRDTQLPVRAWRTAAQSNPAKRTLRLREPLQLTPAQHWGRPGQGPLPGAGHEHNSQRKPWGLGWPRAGTGRAGPRRANLSSGVHAPGQPFQARPPPPPSWRPWSQRQASWH